MTTNSNIYDIDGNKLRDAGDTSKLDIKEAEKRLDNYKSKYTQLSENEPNSPKLAVYMTYIKNLSSYIFNYYITHPEEYHKSSTKEQVEKAMEELKAEVDNDNMDEYVDFVEEPANTENNE